jgi:hypothetical protein
MKRVVEFPFEDGNTVMVEVQEWEREEGTVRVTRGPGNIAERAKVTFEDAMIKIKPAAESIISILHDLSHSPDEIEVEFGLKLNSEAGAIIASVGAEANFKVTLTWKHEGRQ